MDVFTYLLMPLKQANLLIIIIFFVALLMRLPIQDVGRSVFLCLCMFSLPVLI